jgi:hypothetical protein
MSMMCCPGFDVSFDVLLGPGSSSSKPAVNVGCVSVIHAVGTLNKSVNENTG